MSASETFRIAGIALILLGASTGVALATRRCVRTNRAAAASAFAVLLALTLEDPNVTSADARDYTRAGSLILIVLATIIAGLLGWILAKAAQWVWRRFTRP